MTDHRCVQFVPFRIIHRAAVSMDAEKRKLTVWQWQDEFELEYNVKFSQLKADVESYCVIFPSDQDYTMFMLRWA